MAEITRLLRQLLAAALAVLAAEAALARAELAANARQALRGTLFIGLGLLLAGLAVLVGVAAAGLALAPLVGPVKASLIVLAVLVLGAGWLVSTGLSALKQARPLPQRSLARLRHLLSRLEDSDG
jgi:hypothetical protein